MAKKQTIDEQMIPISVKRKLNAILDEFDTRSNETVEPPLERLRILLETAKDDFQQAQTEGILWKHGIDPGDYPTPEARRQAAERYWSSTYDVKQQLGHLGDLLADSLRRLKAADDRWAERYTPTKIEQLDRRVREMIRKGFTHLSTGVKFGAVELETILEHLKCELKELQDAQTVFESADELGDVLGIVLHLLVWHNVQLEDAAQRCLMKLEQRCAEELQYPEGLYLIRQLPTGFYWVDSATHGTGWKDRPVQAFSKDEMELQVKKHWAFFQGNITVKRLKETE